MPTSFQQPAIHTAISWEIDFSSLLLTIYWSSGQTECFARDARGLLGILLKVSTIDSSTFGIKPDSFQLAVKLYLQPIQHLV